MRSKSTGSGPEVDQKWAKSGPEVDRKWNARDPQVQGIGKTALH